VVAEDFLQDAQVRQWLDGVEPARTLLTFDSLQALQREPSASQTAIRILAGFAEQSCRCNAVGQVDVSRRAARHHTPAKR
jgi:hypothetical protein